MLDGSANDDKALSSRLVLCVSGDIALTLHSWSALPFLLCACKSCGYGLAAAALLFATYSVRVRGMSGLHGSAMCCVELVIDMHAVKPCPLPLPLPLFLSNSPPYSPSISPIFTLLLLRFSSAIVPSHISTVPDLPTLVKYPSCFKRELHLSC